MSFSMRFLQITLLIFLLSLVQVNLATAIPERIDINGSRIEGVPYVWQRFNGLCNPASLTSILLYYGANVSLESVLDLSGASWGFMYLRRDPMWLLSLGLLSSQLEDIKYLTDSLGFKWTIYSASSQLIFAARRLGIEAIKIQNFTQAWQLLKLNIDQGNPVQLSVDPFFLPPKDYDFLRELKLIGGGHAVIAIGYNSTSVTIMDPGIGVFGDYYGFPPPERCVYSVSLPRFYMAWRGRDFYMGVFKPLKTVGKVFENTLERIHDKLDPPLSLRGVYPCRYRFWSLGYEAFKDFAEDVEPENFETLLLSWLEMFGGDAGQLASLIENITHPLVSYLTLAWHLLNYSLVDLSGFVDKFPRNLSILIQELSLAVSDLGSLSDDYTLIYPMGGNRSRYTLVDAAFIKIAKALRKGFSVAQAIRIADFELRKLSMVLGSVSSHLKVIAKLCSLKFILLSSR